MQVEVISFSELGYWNHAYDILARGMSLSWSCSYMNILFGSPLICQELHDDVKSSVQGWRSD